MTRTGIDSQGEPDEQAQFKNMFPTENTGSQQNDRRNYSCLSRNISLVVEVT